MRLGEKCLFLPNNEKVMSETIEGGFRKKGGL